MKIKDIQKIELKENELLLVEVCENASSNEIIKIKHYFQKYLKGKSIIIYGEGKFKVKKISKDKTNEN